jgi:GTPase SAR1 family protein
MRQTVFEVEEESDDEEEHHNIIKNVIVIGKKKSGKSSIILRLVRNYFSLSYTPTKSIEFSEPKVIGMQTYCFYEIPYLYDFQHNWYLRANVVFIIEEIDTDFWVRFLSTVDPSYPMEVFFITQQNNLNVKYRQYQVNALEFSGFSNLMYHVANL